MKNKFIFAACVATVILSLLVAVHIYEFVHSLDDQIVESFIVKPIAAISAIFFIVVPVANWLFKKVTGESFFKSKKGQ